MLWLVSEFDFGKHTLINVLHNSTKDAMFSHHVRFFLVLMFSIIEQNEDVLNTSYMHFHHNQLYNI